MNVRMASFFIFCLNFHVTSFSPQSFYIKFYLGKIRIRYGVAAEHGHLLSSVPYCPYYLTTINFTYLQVCRIVISCVATLTVTGNTSLLKYFFPPV